MKNKTIAELAYIIKQAKQNNQPQPIFFLGAGASVSGNIPLSQDIAKDILSRYQNSPTIRRLNEDEKSYSKLMECLTPYQRNDLLKEYIVEAKINATHIYLAQLINKRYVDYVLTVNFDNLLLKALAFFNEFPPTYDMAILKDLTTTIMKENSIIYLYGLHSGLWLPNTKEEMDKIKEIVPPLLHSINNKRPWVFIGYSGSDPIFEHIKNLGRFDNGLYWVTYIDHNPNDKVKAFLETPNNNTFTIKGYDSDSFMLKLNNELGLEQPEILDRPFTSIKEMLNNIVDIDEGKHFKDVKGRLEISRSQVNEAIQQFEDGYFSRDARKDSFIKKFQFPEEIQVACEQYLIYFAKFLEDLGINTNTKIETEAKATLFTVTLKDSSQALSQIKDALIIYLSLPAMPDIEKISKDFNDIGVQQLVSNIYHLKSQLVLANSIIQAKDAAIKSLNLTNFQQKQLLKSVGKKETEEEKLFNGIVSIKIYEGKVLKVNLPQLFRLIKRKLKY